MTAQRNTEGLKPAVLNPRWLDLEAWLRSAGTPAAPSVHGLIIALGEWLGDRADGVAGVLSDEERARANRFHFAIDRQRFLLAHAGLRILVGRALGQPPAALVFMPAPRGGLPPRLAQPPGTGLALSLSHSGACVAIALARPGPVGIDVEAKRALPDLEGLARRALTDEEAHVLASLPAAQRESVFLRWWTAKEAALKAHGSGLATPLARTILACDTSQNPVAVSITDGGGALGYEICTIDDARTQGAVVALAAHMSEPKFAAASAAEIFNEPDSQISTA